MTGRMARAGRAHRRMLFSGLIVALGLIVPASALAAGSVSGVSVQVSSLSASATAVDYAVDFETPEALSAGSSTITVAFPSTVGLSGVNCYSVIDDSSSAQRACEGPTTVNGSTVTLTVPSSVPIAAGSEVTVQAGGVSNPTAAGPETIDVSTSADPTPVAVNYTVSAEAAVTHATLTPSSTSVTASSVSDSLQFVVPARLPSNSTITVTFPAGTTLPASDNVDVDCFDETTGAVNQCDGFGATVNGETMTIPAGGGTDAGDEFSVIIFGITNPATAAAADVTVATSAEPKAVSLPETFVAAQSVTAPSLSLSSYSPGATSTWSLAFRAPQRLPNDQGEVTLTAPAGTVFPSSGVLCFDPALLTGLSACNVVSSSGTTLTVLMHFVSNPGDQLSLVVPGVTNPPTMGNLSVDTTADPSPVTLPLSVATPSAATVEASTASASTASQETQAEYALTFTEPAALTGGTSYIALSASSPTTVFDCPTSGASNYVLYDDTSGTSLSLSGRGSCGADRVTLNLPAGYSTAAGDTLTLVAAGAVGNPTASGAERVTLTTEQPTSQVAFPGVGITAPTAPASPVLDVSSTDEDATGASDTTTFAATGGFPNSGNEDWTQLTFGAAAGTQFPAYNEFFGLPETTNDTTGTGSATPATAGNGSTILYPGTGSGFSAAAGDEISVTTAPVKNPSSVGASTATILTSGDPAPASMPYTLGAKTAVTGGVLQLSSLAPGATGVTYTLSFRIAHELTDGAALTVYFPTGTDASAATVSVVDDSTGQGEDITSASTAIRSATANLGSGVDLAAGDEVTFAVGNVTNPSVAGPYELGALTGTDPKAIVLGYTLSASG